MLEIFARKSDIPSRRVATDQVKYFARSRLVGKLAFDLDCSHQTFQNEQRGEAFDAAAIYESLSELYLHQHVLQSDGLSLPMERSLMLSAGGKFGAMLAVNI